MTMDENIEWGINTRFTFLEKLTKMTALGMTQSLVITGEGGLGKTFTVTKTIKNTLTDMDNVHIVKGHSTARGLYNILHDNRNKLIVFDDCDSVLKDKVALNILKGALDSYDERIISWSSHMPKNSEYENEFEFTGAIIFISNMRKDDIDQAILSRSMVVDLTMSVEDKINRMRSVLGKVCSNFSFCSKLDAMNLIEKNKDRISDLNFRTLIKVCKIRNTFPNEWIELSKYMMMEG
jgi:replicative DNA helicase